VRPSLQVSVDEIVGAVPGVALAGRRARVGVALRIDGDVTTVDLSNLDATLAAMGLGDERVTGRARIIAQPAGVALDAAVSLRGAAITCVVEARTDATQHISARTRRCSLSAAALDRLSGAPPGRSHRLALRIDEASAEGTLADGLVVRVTAAANAERVEITGRVTPTHQTADISVHHLSLDRVAPDAPASDLDGTIHVEHTADGAAHELALDTSRLVAAVTDVPVPPVRARARIDGQRITLRELTSQDIGLAAHGEVNLATGQTNFHAEADLDTRDLAGYPWVAGRASGSLRAHVEVDGQGSRITASVRGDARQLRASRLSVGEASFQVTATHELGRPPAGSTQVTASLTATRLYVPRVVGPANGSVRVEGNPFGRLRATVAADGGGLLAALGPAPANATGNTNVRADLDLDLSDTRHVRARVTRSTLRLRGAEAHITGDLAVLSAAQGGASTTGRVRIDAVGHGSLDVAMRGRRVAADLRALDLRWFRPFLAALPPDLEGVLDGSVDIDPANLRDAHASLRIARGRQRAVGGFEGTVELAPLDGITTFRAALDTTRGTRVEADVQVAVPRQTGDLNAWVAGVLTGHIALTRVDLAAYNDLLPLGVGARGTLAVSLDLTRDTPAAPLVVAARVDGRDLTGGLRVLSSFFPVVDPLALRAVTCVTLRNASLDHAPVRLRLALGPSRRGDVAPPPSACEAETPMLTRSYATVDGSVEGTWFSGLQRAAGGLRAHVGPFRRSDWPFHVPSARVAGDRLRYLRPPDLPADASASVELAVTGALLNLGVEVEGEFRTSSLQQAGLTEPVRAQVNLHATPLNNGTVLGPLSIGADANIELSPDAPPAERGQMIVDVSTRAEGAGLLSRGADAVSLERFEIESSNLLLERFAWARERGVRGAVTLHLTQTNNRAAPLDATATITGLRAQMGGEGAERRESNPVQVKLGARVVSRGEDGWTLHSCVEATPRALDPVGTGPGVHVQGCDPLSTQAPDQTNSLRATVSLPVDGELFAPRPRVDRASVTLHARDFALETFTPLVRSDSIAGVGGALDATLQWHGGSAAPIEGTMRVSRGHADIIALGERLRDLEVSLRASGTSILVDRTSFVLGNGRMDINGSVDLSGALAPGARATPDPSAPLAVVRMDGEARALPMGVEGNTYGWIDGHVGFGMSFARDGARGDVVVDRAQVRLKEEQTRDLQPLGQDGDVFILGRTVLNGVPSAAPYPMSIGIDLPDPVVLQRSDLSVAIRGHVQAARERGGWGVGGTIENASTQGWFSVLGKRFELDRLRVVLDGSVSINPQLDIAAHHNAVTGDRLNATVGGRLRAPTMEFASVNNPGLSQAEVLAMIALGRSDSQGANANGDLGQQAGAAFASLVGAMTFGTLSRGLRFVPTLVLEPGQGNSGRYGAGVALGPRFYVQVTYGAASSAFGQSSTAAQVFRGLIEFAISQAWSASASVASGLGGTSASGGVDVFWSP
jgi:hypothetical protein